MSVGRSKPKRRAPAGASPHRPRVVAALVAVLGVLLVLLLTWGNRAPERRGPVTGRATRDDAPPSATARSDTFRLTPESPPGDSADRGDRPVPRRGGSRRRPSRDEGAPAGGGIGSASPGQPGAVAGEVGAEDEALGEGQQEDSGSGQETEAVDPLAFANRPEKEYETGSETDAGKLKGLTGEGGTISFWLQPAWDGT